MSAGQQFLEFAQDHDRDRPENHLVFTTVLQQKAPYSNKIKTIIYSIVIYPKLWEVQQMIVTYLDQFAWRISDQMD